MFMISHINKYRFCDQCRLLISRVTKRVKLKQRRTDMLMLDRRMLLRAGSAAVGAAALDPATPALAYAWRTLCRAPNDDTRSNIPASGAILGARAA